jgi:putative endonuclease
MILGPEGEALATAYLMGKGLTILHRNYKTPFGEADIIARQGTTIIFVEVKTRTTTAFGEPFEAVDRRKQERLRRIALYYQKQHGGAELPIRFDVISIKRVGNDTSIEHITDAF